tara:strand:- start:1495 stop:2949 length:1455 start_codon:yes stop_codon:yes gene_type:complete
MANIGTLTVLSKTSIKSEHLFRVTDPSDDIEKSYMVSHLFPIVNTLGAGAHDIFGAITNRNQLNFKGIKSSTASMLNIATVSNNLEFSLLPAGIDLNQCDNTNAGFIKSVNLSHSIAGVLTPINGGTGLTQFQKGSIPIAVTENSWSTARVQNDGEILIGNSSTGYPVVSTLTQGTNVTISNTPGNITISANLANLTANFGCSTFNIDLDRAAGPSWVSGDGSKEGLTVDGEGRVFIGDNTPTLPSAQTGQLQLGGSDTKALVVGSPVAYGDRSITYVDAPANTDGAKFEISGSDAATANHSGGGILLKAGAATGTGKGGNVTIQGGGGDSSAHKGHILLSTGATAVTIDNSQNVIASAGSVMARATTVPAVVKAQVTQAVVLDGTTVITGAEMLTGIATCTPAGSRSKSTDTASNIITALNLTADNDSVDWIFINLASATNGVTITGGAAVSVIGNMIVDANTSGMFRVRRISSSTVTLYRIG